MVVTIDPVSNRHFTSTPPTTTSTTGQLPIRGGETCMLPVALLMLIFPPSPIPEDPVAAGVAFGRLTGCVSQFSLTPCTMLHHAYVTQIGL